jgi:outer membrane lipoprotein-sorting protein
MASQAGWRLMVGATALALTTTSLHSNQSEADALRRSKAVYAALKSYADTGTVIDEHSGFSGHSVFKTYFRRTDAVDFYFDYTFQYQVYSKDSSRLPYNNSRRLWWMRNHNLQTYNFETKEHRTYPATSNQAGSLNEPRTKGASLLITELLFRSANLPGTILQIEESSAAGMEDVGGHVCYKVLGVAAAYYPSGQRTNVRQVTVWIDRDSLLIRKVFEDTPTSYGPDGINRLTFLLEPQANPTLDDSKFDFQVPGIQ